MKILVLGGGGREHALVWKLKQSPGISEIFSIPGNAGIAELATCAPFKITEIAKIIEFAKNMEVGLTVVGPDEALAAGIVDQFEAAGLRIFGPNRNAARLESSKVFAKEFMVRHGIPTASYGSFSDSSEAQKFARSLPKPLVVKADGLALGKGVIIARTGWEAAMAIHRIMDERTFGDAGGRVVIEEFLEGIECSIHALVDGTHYLLFPGAQDHKRALDGDEGPNTGGMGTFSPSRALTPEIAERVRHEVLDRFIAGVQADGIDYRGVLFPGLMITPSGPKVLEFNCRFGDPETQVLLPRLESDLVELLGATIDRRLSEVQTRWNPQAAVCVIMASGGYPGSYRTGAAITGLERTTDDVHVFHAGTKVEDGKVVTAGGRVLGVTASGRDLNVARDRAYAAVRGIDFEGSQYRTDIATKGVSA